MTEPPKCPICLTHHHENQAHVFKPAAEIKTSRNKVHLVEIPGHIKTEIKADSTAKQQWRERNRPAYNEYMKNYMRQYREDNK